MVQTWHNASRLAGWRVNEESDSRYLNIRGTVTLETSFVQSDFIKPVIRHVVSLMSEKHCIYGQLIGFQRVCMEHAWKSME